MFTHAKFHTAQSQLKRTGLLATITIATALSCINVKPVQAQLSEFTRPPKAKLAPRAQIIFKQKELTTANNQTVSVEAICPLNTTTISGGGRVNPRTVNAYLKTSTPNPRANPEPYTRVWRITGINLTGKPVIFTAYAICAQVSNQTTPLPSPAK